MPKQKSQATLLKEQMRTDEKRRKVREKIEKKRAKDLEKETARQVQADAKRARKEQQAKERKRKADEKAARKEAKKRGKDAAAPLAEARKKRAERPKAPGRHTVEPSSSSIVVASKKTAVARLRAAAKPKAPELDLTTPDTPRGLRHPVDLVISSWRDADDDEVIKNSLVTNAKGKIPHTAFRVLRNIAEKAMTDLEKQLQKPFSDRDAKLIALTLLFRKNVQTAQKAGQPKQNWPTQLTQALSYYQSHWARADVASPPPVPKPKKRTLDSRLRESMVKLRIPLPSTSYSAKKVLQYTRQEITKKVPYNQRDKLGNLAELIYPKKRLTLIRRKSRDGATSDGVTDELSSSSGSKAPKKSAVDDGTSSGVQGTVPHPGGVPHPPGKKKPAKSSADTDLLQADGSPSHPKAPRLLPKRKAEVVPQPPRRSAKKRKAPKAAVPPAKRPAPFGGAPAPKAAPAQPQPPQVPVALGPVAALIAQQPAPIQGPIAPIIPLNAPAPQPFNQVNLGLAPAVNVANREVFQTSWDDLTISLVDIALKNGNIRVTGGTATIRCSKSGKQAKGDIVKISRFIKRYYKLGGYLDGRKMSSQRLIRHILTKLPGIFTITS